MVAIAVLSMTSGITNAASTPSCANDVDQMRFQIERYQSITSYDGHRFNDLQDTSDQSRNACSAQGYYFGKYICTLKWQLDNWGDTFHCG